LVSRWALRGSASGGDPGGGFHDDQNLFVGEAGDVDLVLVVVALVVAQLDRHVRGIGRPGRAGGVIELGWPPSSALLVPGQVTAEELGGLQQGFEPPRQPGVSLGVCGGEDRRVLANRRRQPPGDLGGYADRFLVSLF
jgi:hypothetical protein